MGGGSVGKGPILRIWWWGNMNYSLCRKQYGTTQHCVSIKIENKYTLLSSHPTSGHLSCRNQSPRAHRETHTGT